MSNLSLRRGAALIALLAGAARVLATEIPFDYHIPLTPENAVLGCFPASKKPVLTIQSGAVVKIDGGGGGGAVRDNPDPTKYLNDNHIPITPGTLACLEETARVQKEAKKYPGALMGHMLVGPIYIEGAEAGDSIEIRILDVTPRITFGNTAAGRAAAVWPSAWVPKRRPGDFAEHRFSQRNPAHGYFKCLRPVQHRGELPRHPSGGCDLGRARHDPQAPVRQRAEHLLVSSGGAVSESP